MTLLTGRLTVDLPPAEAYELFTPRGEERWVPGWRPRFPAAGDAGAGGVVRLDLQDDPRQAEALVRVGGHEPQRSGGQALAAEGGAHRVADTAGRAVQPHLASGRSVVGGDGELEALPGDPRPA